MAREAVTNRWLMDVPLDLGRILIGVAGETEAEGGGGDELDARDVFADPNLMAAQAAHRDSGMDRLAFRFVVVAFQALGRVDVLIQRNGVNGGGGARDQERDQSKES